MKRRFLVGFIAGILTAIVLLVIGLVVIQHISPSEERGNGAEAGEFRAEFPAFFVSDPSLKTKTSHEIKGTIIGKESGKHVGAVDYCIVLSDGRWACAYADNTGNFGPIYTEREIAFKLYCGESAEAIWKDHALKGIQQAPKINCPQLPPTPGADATDRFQCEGL